MNKEELLHLKFFHGTEYKIKLKDRVNIIVGESGSGKTLLDNFINDFKLMGLIESNSTRNFGIFPNNLDETFIESVLKSNEGNILIIDEEVSANNGKRLISNKNFIENVFNFDITYIIIGRVDNNIKHSALAHYELKQDKDGVIRNYSYYNKYLDHPELVSTDRLITEDSGAGCKLFESVGINTVSLEGIDNLTNWILDNKVKDCHLLVDLANFDPIQYQIIELFKNNVNIISRECFEEQILKSSIIQDNKELFQFFKSELERLNDKQYKTHENFYEDLCNKVLCKIYDKPKSYEKGWRDFPNCFKIPCQECNRFVVCKYRNEDIENKLLDIVVNNNLDYLLPTKSKHSLPKIDIYSVGFD